MGDTVDWTGSVDGCNAGSTSDQSQQYSLDIINFDRALGGLDPVSLDSTLNADAQAGALIMSANNNLSHSVPTNWKCYTQQGASAAASSDLFLGESGAQAIDGYMIDPGSNNVDAGHRRWIMYPAATTMGTGSTSNSNDLYVFGGRASDGNYADPSWVAWPTAGYVPDPLEPNGRWSLSGSAEHDYDFGKATVSVTAPSGKKLPVTVNKPANGYGADTIVFQVGSLATPTDSPLAYTVAVKGIVEDGKKVSHSYIVKLFNPNTVDVVAAPAVSGYERVGQVLSVVAPEYSPAATTLSYRWYRDGKSISGATHSTRTLTSSDLGHSIRLHVTAHRSGYGALITVTSPTAKIAAALKPTASTTPKLSGTPTVGSTLSATSGEWNPDNVSVRYQWYRSGKAIAGSTSSQRVLTASDRSKKISVKVSIAASGYSSTSKTLTTPTVK